MRTLTFFIAGSIALGCARGDPPAPTLERVEPGEGGAAPAAVAVFGSGFAPLIHANLDHPAWSTADVAFEGALSNGELEVPLGEVTFVDAHQLSAVVPGDLPAGPYDLRVIDPRGRTATLRGAYSVRAPVLECPGLPGPHCLIGGACVAALAVNPANPCERCDPGESQTGWSPAADGLGCDDGDACTRGEACHGGRCGEPTQTVTCGGDGGCGAGTCDPATGACTVILADGTSCDDGDACTQGETCSAGVCGRPTGVTVCPQGQCVTSTCSKDTGGCELALRPDDTPCNDHNVCTPVDVCKSGACRGDSSCANTAPRACLTVTPSAVLAGTVVSFDATCSTDLEDLTSSLQARFDFGDGTSGAAFGPLTAAHAYPDGGVFEALVEVRDLDGLSTFARRLVSVSVPLDDVVVTTSADESDPGATPSAPGGAGLSLREAVAFVNAGPVARKIRFDGPMTIALGSPLPNLTVAGTVVAGGSDVTLDFSGVVGTAGCLTLYGANQWLIGVAAGGCGGQLLQIRGAGSHVAECRLGFGARDVNGALIQAGSVVFGPRNDVAGLSGAAVTVRGAGALVIGNRLHDVGVGVSVENGGDSARIVGNEIDGCANQGVYAHLGNPGPSVLHNTIVASGSNGIELATPLGPSVVENNIVFGSAQRGFHRATSLTPAEDHNLYFGNLQGAVTPGAPGAGAVLLDPIFLGPEVGDFRLAPQSPALNVGAAAGVDVNGPRAGLFDGTAPDLGAWESPY